MILFSILKRVSRYGLLLLGAMTCQLFVSSAVMASASLRQLGPEVMLVLQVLGTPTCAVALVIGVLGALWLREEPRSGYVLSLVYAMFMSIINISSQSLKLDLLFVLSICEIPVVTFIGGFVYGRLHKLMIRKRR